MTSEFLQVTEIAGQRVSREQLDRMCHRYRWAATQSAGCDVIELACGAGQGLEILSQSAARVVAGDVSPEVLDNARKVAPGLELGVYGAEKVPYADASFDRVILFEALYYVDAAEFFAEARRLLRAGGALLLATANKDLYDFTPSPFTKRYLGAIELTDELERAGFSVKLWGYIDTHSVSLRQRVLRPLKAFASRWGLIPKTMHGKELLKKLFFGEMARMPASLTGVPCDASDPRPITGDAPDTRHKVLYCRADLRPVSN